MPSYIHEVDLGESESLFICIEIDITFRGSPGSYWEPPEYSEFEIEDAYFVTPISENEANALRASGSGCLSIWQGRGKGNAYYSVGENLTKEEIEKYKLEDVINNNWDPSWDEDDCDPY